MINNVETTNDTLTSRGGMVLFAKYLSMEEKSKRSIRK